MDDEMHTRHTPRGTKDNDSDIAVEKDDRTVGEVPSKMLPALLIDTLKTEN